MTRHQGQRWNCKSAYTPTESSGVEPIHAQSDSKRHGSDSVFYLQWPQRQCVDTSRVESSRVESSRVESSPASLDAACFIFVCQTPVIGREGRNGCRGTYSFSEGTRGNLRRLAL